MSKVERTKEYLVHNVLGLDDTPLRIAWGVFWGFLIAWTPTLGLQILLYLAVASLVRANHVSGIPPLFISNVATAVPVYGFTWWVGRMILHGEADGEPQLDAAATDSLDPFSADIATSAFWEAAWAKIVDLGAELWVGGLVVGVITGVPAALVAYYAVIAFRRSRAERASRTSLPPTAPATASEDSPETSA